MTLLSSILYALPKSTINFKQPNSEEMKLGIMRSNKFKSTLHAINSKINGIPKGVYLFISKPHSILAVANLLALNNLWLCN